MTGSTWIQKSFCLLAITWLCQCQGDYWSDEITEGRSDITKACHVVSTFTPNFCSLSSTMQYCSVLCDKRLNQDFLTCGGRRRMDSHKIIQRRIRRIVGGQSSQQGEWPWMVNLRVNGTQWCGGSILSERFILTAAHCFDDAITSKKASDWHIYAGDHELKVDETFEQIVKVKNIFLHPEFSLELHQQEKGDWVTARNDIAIMELKEPINLQDENKGTLCLPENRQPIGDVRTSCHVAGWGHTSFNGTQPNRLMHADVWTVPTSICNLPKVYNGTVDGKYLICAGYVQGGKDACNYDSGGALVCPQKGRWHATGIVSSGFECARENAYGLYTRVTTNKNWIVQTILRSQLQDTR